DGGGGEGKAKEMVGGRGAEIGKGEHRQSMSAAGALRHGTEKIIGAAGGNDEHRNSRPHHTALATSSGRRRGRRYRGRGAVRSRLRSLLKLERRPGGRPRQFSPFTSPSLGFARLVRA